MGSNVVRPLRRIDGILLSFAHCRNVLRFIGSNSARSAAVRAFFLRSIMVGIDLGKLSPKLSYSSMLVTVAGGIFRAADFLILPLLGAAREPLLIFQRQ